jgi:alkylation response protein AidB-like acyl-CoA dehydrogenase
VHGGIGATWEHDAPWFWRRAQLSRLLLGGEGVAADRIAEEAISRAKAGNGRASMADAAAAAPAG